MLSDEVLKKMSAEDLIKFIANDYVELSQEKVVIQRNDYIKMSKRWLELNK
jgi:hypothetical protein